MARLVFMGTPQFAVPSLQAVAAAGYTVAAVFTQPDRPRGRGQHEAMPPVKQAAVQLGLPVQQPERIRRPEAVDLLRELRADVMVVVGYGQIIPQAILDLPPLGIVNVHASLLPKYRGAAPIQWAIANGELITGVTTMRIDAGLDTGDMLLKWQTSIGPQETAPALSERLASAGAALLVDTLRGMEAGTIQPQPQPHSEATYAPILRKEDGRIDWHWTASQIDCRVRGLQPWPGCTTRFRGQDLRLWRACVRQENTGELPGTVLPYPKLFCVACGQGSVLELQEVQLEGKKQMTVSAFLNGHPAVMGERLGES